MVNRLECDQLRYEGALMSNWTSYWRPPPMMPPMPMRPGFYPRPAVPFGPQRPPMVQSACYDIVLFSDTDEIYFCTVLYLLIVQLTDAQSQLYQKVTVYLSEVVSLDMCAIIVTVWSIVLCCCLLVHLVITGSFVCSR